MPDANLFRQECAGVVFWTGVFDREPVVLLLVGTPLSLYDARLVSDQYRLHKITSVGSLVEMCKFTDGIGVCLTTGRKLKLNVTHDARTAYVTTVDRPVPPPPKSDYASHGQKTWHFNPDVDELPPKWPGWAKDFFKPGPNRNGDDFSSVKPKVLDPLIHCFDFLGISSAPSANEIDSAFRTKIKAAHPDHNRGSTDAQKRTRDLVAARDEARRRMNYK